MERYHVRLSKGQLLFSAAHFITYAGDRCERLHGHNYRVAVEVYGPLDENHYVADFVAVRDALRAILAEWDHHVLLPTEHPRLGVAAGPQEVEVRLGECRWVFPRDDCVLLAVANTTAEVLARLLGQKLLEALGKRLGVQPEGLRIEVEESPGQAAVCELRGQVASEPAGEPLDRLTGEAKEDPDSSGCFSP